MKTYHDKKDLNRIIWSIIMAGITLAAIMLIVYAIKFANVIDTI